MVNKMRKPMARKMSEYENEVATSRPPDVYGLTASIMKACREWERKRGIPQVNNFVINCRQRVKPLPKK